MTEKIKQNKIVIAGAGLVGLSFALLMKNTNLSIHILETHLPEILTPAKTDSRPISLSFGSYRILNSLGIWDELASIACPILSVHVSEKGHLGFTRFSAKEQKLPALGYVVPFAQLQSALYHAVAASKNITITSITTLEGINRDLEGVQIKTNNLSINADLLVAADGTHSVCRDLLHIAVDEKNSNDVACIYELSLSKDHDHTAYERFTTFGVFAVLPLHEKNRAKLVWTRKECDTDTDTDTDKIIKVFEGRLLIAAIKKIAQFPLKTIIAEKQVLQSSVLLGNSAHTIYPVAAQGFNLGLHDAAILCDALKEAIENKKNIGHLSVLKKYEAIVKTHQEKIYRVTGELMGLFELPFIGFLRAKGLLTMDILKPIKNKLVKRMTK